MSSPLSEQELDEIEGSYPFTTPPRLTVSAEDVERLKGHAALTMKYVEELKQIVTLNYGLPEVTTEKLLASITSLPRELTHYAFISGFTLGLELSAGESTDIIDNGDLKP